MQGNAVAKIYGTRRDEYDSCYCNVDYIEKDNVVLLRWKSFCSLNEYREATLFVANLLTKYDRSYFVIDARKGFAKEEADIEWGIRVLIPYMAHTGCQKCVFIIDKNNIPYARVWQSGMSIEQELEKVFDVSMVNNYCDAIKVLYS